MSKIKTSIGGQALIEGIMMRGPVKTAMAVRGPGGNIVLEENPTKGANRPKICRLPVIRGVFGMIDSLTVGYKCLMRSAEISGMDEEENEKAAAKRAKKNEQRAAKGKPPLPEGPTLSDKLFNTLLMPLATVLAVALAFGLFYWLPMQLWNWIVPSGTHSYFARACFEGVLRILIFVGYIWATSLMKDIRRTYHVPRRGAQDHLLLRGGPSADGGEHPPTAALPSTLRHVVLDSDAASCPSWCPCSSASTTCRCAWR